MAALHIRIFCEASRAYTKDNYAAIQALLTTPTAPAIINAATLIAAGKLPSGYSATCTPVN